MGPTEMVAADNHVPRRLHCQVDPARLTVTARSTDLLRPAVRSTHPPLQRTCTDIPHAHPVPRHPPLLTHRHPPSPIPRHSHRNPHPKSRLPDRSPPLSPCVNPSGHGSRDSPPAAASLPSTDGGAALLHLRTMALLPWRHALRRPLLPSHGHGQTEGW